MSIDLDVLSTRLSRWSSYAHEALIYFHIQSLLSSCLVEYIGEMAFAAVLAVVHGSHEYTGSALYLGSASTPIGTFHVVILTSAVGHSLLKRSILPSPSTL